MTRDIAYLIDWWGVEKAKQISYAAEQEKKHITYEDFMSQCVIKENDWIDTVLTGVEKLYPSVYKLIDDDSKDAHMFTCMMILLMLCGVKPL